MSDETYPGIFKLDKKKCQPGVIEAMYKHIAKRIRDHRKWIISEYRRDLAQSDLDQSYLRRKLKEDLKAAPVLAWGYQQEFFKKNRMLLRHQYQY